MPWIETLRQRAIERQPLRQCSLSGTERGRLLSTKAAFGAEEIFSIADPAGSLVAQLSIGTSDFWLADESPENANFSPESLNGITARMILAVDDPDKTFERAVAAGATVVWPVEDKSYGWRVGRVKDPFGHHWEVGKPLR